MDGKHTKNSINNQIKRYFFGANNKYVNVMIITLTTDQ